MSSATPPFKDAAGRIVPGSVAEAGFWNIGGVDQWVVVRGLSVANPILIILHGGPGSPETVFFRGSNAAVEDAYTVVYWDQRGAGRSFSKAIAPESMTIEQFIADLDELTDRLRARFGKAKVAILGHSWGSALGVLYAQRHPDKVSVYVGVGQVADMAASEEASYAFALARAHERGHRRAIAQLEAIGPPPHTLKQVGTQRRWLIAMGGALGPNLSLTKMIWRGVTGPESSLLDLVRLVRGSNFSTKALWTQLMDVNLSRDVLRFEMPVFFVLGRLDMQVAAPVSAAYFDLIEAPVKALVWFENSGHMAPFEEPALFNRLMIDKVRAYAL
jgi:pimeloyl-ACP methyl ester carboxylesterase